MLMGGPPRMLERETSKPVNVGATLTRLGGYFRPHWAILLGVAALVVAGTYAQVLSPALIGQAVDCYLAPMARTGASGCWFATPNSSLTGAEAVAGLGQLIGLVVALYVAGAVAGGAQFYLMSLAGQRVLRRLRSQLFQHMHRLSIGYYATHEVGALMSRLTNDIDTLQQALSFALVSVVGGALLVVWIAAQMLSVSVPYALLSMAILPLMAGATLWLSDQARRAYRTTRVEIGRVNADLQESIAGVREMQAFGREDANIESFRATNAANRDANIRAVAFTSALAPSLEALGYVAMAIVAVAGGLALLRGQDLFGTGVSLGLIVTFLGYVQRFNQPIAQIATLWTNLQSAVAGAERIFGLLDEEPDVRDRPDAIEMPPIVGEVTFDAVDAAYIPGELVLAEVSFRALPGQTIAIVGATGAGKTTIVNLIPRFYDVAAGAVRIDGIDVRAVRAESLRRQIGVVLQDTFLFSDSVMANIRVGRPSATDAEVIAAARLAQAHELIERLPDGYGTVLGERGRGLSQGQRQLIAIARAALADPRILILDEATASVDTRTERQIQRALETLMQGRTSFVIAHRLATVRHADVVLVVEGGRIVERGTHEELLARHGAYAALYRRQFLRPDETATAAAG